MKNMNTIDKENEVSDKVGIVLSVLCCIHCMAIPFLIVFAPALGQLFQDEIFHNIALATVVPLGLYSFISKIKLHSDKRPLIIGVIGMLFLIAGHLFHVFSHEGHSHGAHAHGTIELVELVGSIVGGLSLVVAHILNIRLCRCKSCDH